jgi:hypothetical protein
VEKERRDGRKWNSMNEKRHERVRNMTFIILPLSFQSASSFSPFPRPLLHSLITHMIKIKTQDPHLAPRLTVVIENCTIRLKEKQECTYKQTDV